MIPCHGSDGPERPEWKRWLIGLVGTSVLFAGVWGLLTRDAMQALLAAALPFAVIGACMLIALSWAMIIIPLLLVVGKVFGEQKKQEREPKANDS